MFHALSTSIRLVLNVFILFIISVSCKYENTTRRDPCMRTCQANSTALTCHYKFKVEKYFTLSKACFNCPEVAGDCMRPDCIPADGMERILTVINRKMPGPGIYVCVGDTVIVDVHNEMTEEATSVHWHGHHQLNTPYMDGVPFITQCPIAPGTTFRYKFTAALPGTNFYHSHSGTQRADGLYGPFVIRQPQSMDIHGKLYDYDLPEHVIITTDWIHESGSMKYLSHYHGTGSNKPDTILVNGMGKYRKFPVGKKRSTYTPLAKFSVVQGKRYRFRFINAGVLYCPIEISIDNHSMTVINSDGGDMKPVHAESLVTYAGERWDVIINANNNVSNYWIKFKGLKDCDEHFNSAYAVAVLHYQGANNTLPTSTVTYNSIHRTGMQVNPVNVGSGKKGSLTAAELKSQKTWIDPALKKVPDIVLTFAFDFYPIDNPLFHKQHLYGFNQVKKEHQRYIPQINHISMKMPSFPVLSEPELITKDTFCDEKSSKNCTNKFCHCTYTIELPLDQTVEIIFVDEGVPYESNHPFHLHGHSFRVIAMDKVNKSTTLDEVLALNRTNQIHRNLKNPPLKDTITVPDGGYTIIRFHTKNPGYWLLHCHLDFHVEAGMAVLLKVGNTTDFTRPPENFPTCGDFYNAGASQTTPKDDLSSSNNTSINKAIISTENAVSGVFAHFWTFVKNSFAKNGSSSCCVRSSLYFTLIICYVLRYL